jgi:hypothetical protein
VACQVRHRRAMSVYGDCFFPNPRQTLSTVVRASLCLTAWVGFPALVDGASASRCHSLGHSELRFWTPVGLGRSQMGGWGS